MAGAYGASLRDGKWVGDDLCIGGTREEEGEGDKEGWVEMMDLGT